MCVVVNFIILNIILFCFFEISSNWVSYKWKKIIKVKHKNTKTKTSSLHQAVYKKIMWLRFHEFFSQKLHINWIYIYLIWNDLKSKYSCTKRRNPMSNSIKILFKNEQCFVCTLMV